MPTPPVWVDLKTTGDSILLKTFNTPIKSLTAGSSLSCAGLLCWVCWVSRLLPTLKWSVAKDAGKMIGSFYSSKNNLTLSAIVYLYNRQIRHTIKYCYSKRWEKVIKPVRTFRVGTHHVTYINSNFPYFPRISYKDESSRKLLLNNWCFVEQAPEWPLPGTL